MARKRYREQGTGTFFGDYRTTGPCPPATFFDSWSG